MKQILSVRGYVATSLTAKEVYEFMRLGSSLDAWWFTKPLGERLQQPLLKWMELNVGEGEAWMTTESAFLQETDNDEVEIMIQFNLECHLSPDMDAIEARTLIDEGLTEALYSDLVQTRQTNVYMQTHEIRVAQILMTY